MGKPFNIRLDEDPFYDELHIETVPRFKTSGLSGDEWRWSYVVTILRKGVVLAEQSWGRWDWAIEGIHVMLMDLSDKGLGDDGGRFADLCMSLGCKEKATNIYRVVKRGCGHCGNRDRFTDDEYRRQFCDLHAKRGDSDLDDSDDNYEVISGRKPGEGEVRQSDVLESVFGGVINASELLGSEST